jgi:DNA-binding response OmpR family regulator
MADFDDVVIKPYRLDDLLKRMEGMLRRLDTEGQHAHVHGHTQSPIMPSHVRRMTG